ncbi:MAG: ABC transporter permease [Candidatus Woesearchaeota archaeon]|jgi:putative ABC transport system permease protein
MKRRKSLKYAFNMVLHSRLRSWLTILGIIIGVASVIAIVSFSNGMQAEMETQMGSIGADIITLSPGFSKGAGAFGRGESEEGGASSSNSDAILGRQDVQILRGISEIKYFDTEISGKAEIYYMGETGDVSITGVDQSVWSKVTTEEIGEGRMLDAADQNVVVIGYELAHTFFKNEIGINKIIRIGGIAYRVVGILSEGTRNNIYMPLESAYLVIEDATTDNYNSVIIKVKEDVDVDTIMQDIETKLMISRHVTESDKDFTLTSSAQLLEMRDNMLSTLTYFLTGIAAISLLVGAIGIANTMFTSVLEKTKEIGIMKAIGARNNDIMYIFLFNAAIIGLVGGLLGVISGIIISYGLGSIVGLNAVVTPGIVFIALSVSVSIGICSGVIPAYQGSQLSPVDALRYE